MRDGGVFGARPVAQGRPRAAGASFPAGCLGWHAQGPFRTDRRPSGAGPRCHGAPALETGRQRGHAPMGLRGFAGCEEVPVARSAARSAARSTLPEGGLRFAGRVMRGAPSVGGLKGRMDAERINHLGRGEGRCLAWSACSGPAAAVNAPASKSLAEASARRGKGCRRPPEAEEVLGQPEAEKVLGQTGRPSGDPNDGSRARGHR